jgi:hypothetical protein
MPMPLLRAFIRELPAIQARAQLRLMTAVAIAFGTARNGREIVRDLQRDARGGSGERRSSVGEARLLAAAMGFKVVSDG